MKNSKETDRKIFKAGLFIIILGICLILIKGFTPEYVSADGILHEAFFLLPLGFGFIGLGLVSVTVAFIVKRVNRKDN